ncbi:Cysteine protease, C1A family [Oscillospiraceae bacterium]|nr:Cysteine protease, C1A family [Oscillospiraceae bacterium]
MKSKSLKLTALLLIAAVLMTSCGIGRKKYKNYLEIPDEVPSEYSIFDEGIARRVDSQVGGTCWASAATTVMEYGYARTTRHTTQMDSTSLAFMVYNPHTTEGYYLDDRTGAYDIGGNSDLVVDITSNGFGDYTLVDSCDLTDASNEDIKRAIMAFGGVTAGISDDQMNYTWGNGTYTMIGSPEDVVDHSVAIVGWDDSFPADAFATTATQNGAWYVQNSYSRTWGDGGFYWVSYDTPLENVRSLIMANNYAYVAHHESGYSANLSTGRSTTAANVFDRTGRLAAVGTYTTCANQRLNITIYDKDMDKVLDSYSAEFEFPGYHTITLDEPLMVEGVAIAITYSGSGAPVEGPDWHHGGSGYNASISEGQSFVRHGNEWLDLADPGTLPILGVQGTTNNVCIKALYTS